MPIKITNKTKNKHKITKIKFTKEKQKQNPL